MEQEWVFCVFPDGHTELLKRDEIPETEGIIKYGYFETRKL